MKSRDTRTMREKRSERFKRIDRNRRLDKIYESDVKNKWVNSSRDYI